MSPAFFRLVFNNKYVVIINTCDLPPARMLREVEEDGPSNAFGRPSIHFQQNGESSNCSEESNSKGWYEVMRKNEEGKIGWILLWVLGIPLPILLILYVLRGCT